MTNFESFIDILFFILLVYLDSFLGILINNNIFYFSLKDNKICCIILLHLILTNNYKTLLNSIKITQ